MYARRRKTKQRQNTICVGHHYAQANTNNVNKTRHTLDSFLFVVFQFSWISLIVCNHETKNSTKLCPNNIGVCMVYSKGSTNLDIHENTFFLQTTEIDIHVFK